VASNARGSRAIDPILPHLRCTARSSTPLIAGRLTDRPTPISWFGEFDPPPRVWEPQTSPQFPSYEPPPFRLLTDAACYNAELKRIASCIFAGDIYQANFTFDAIVDVPPETLAELRPRQRAGWGTLIENGSHITSVTQDMCKPERI